MILIKDTQNYKSKFHLITNGCDISEYKKYWDAEIVPNEKFTIIHSGGMSNSRNPAGLFDALTRIKKRWMHKSK